jgi:hypothetical protein
MGYLIFLGKKICTFCMLLFQRRHAYKIEFQFPLTNLSCTPNYAVIQENFTGGSL